MESSRPKERGNVWLIVIVVVLAFFSGYLFNKVKILEGSKSGGVQGANTANPQAQANVQKAAQGAPDFKIAKPSSSKDHWRGSKQVRYIWVEYSDLECPFCKRVHPDLIKLLEANKNNMAWVYRHFPLPGHPKAQKSAEAVECAADQKGNDAFWKMNDLIFEKMPEMELSDLPSLAASIGLNADTFKKCLDGGKFEKKVKDQSSEGSGAGVSATPTGVLYDLKTDKSKVIEGALPLESLQSELDTFMKS